MNRLCKFLTAFLVLSISCTTCRMQGTAAEARTYTIALYAGNHGRFADTSFVTVAGEGTEAVVGIEEDGRAIRVSGLKENEIVVFDAASEGAVAMEEDSKYYIKGIRRSGRDNSEVDTPAVSADADRDYVIAYAVRGDMVSYEVKYEDKAGRALAQSRVYYGNVGDRPVAAFIYIPGYVPQAYNLTKTLSQNAAENVFTFVYSRLPSSGQESGSSQGTGKESDDTGENAAGAAQSAEETAIQEMPGNEAPVLAGNGTESATPEETAARTGQEEDYAAVPDTDTPREIVGLDDEEVPGAEGKVNARDTAFFEHLIVAALAIPALSLACLILRLRKAGREREEDE